MASFVGFRFHPTPQELIGHYLMKKRRDPAFSVHKIRDFNIYGCEPSELPKIFPDQPDEQEWWHFFCERNYIYANSKRVNRKTRGGNWKVTGKKRDIKDKRKKKVIGWKITLVFYEGSGNSKEARTNWVMHEYHIQNDPLFKREFVVIRVRKNTDIKHDNPPSTNEGIPIPNVISSSGNHYSENIDFQAESDFGHHPLSNPDISFNNEFQNISSNHNIPHNSIFQSSSLIYSEFQEISSNRDISFNSEFQSSSLNHSEFQTDSNYAISFNSEFQKISTNRDISFNSEFQSSSLNHGEFQTDGNYSTSFNSEFQEISTNHDISFNSEFQSSSLNHSEFQTDGNYSISFNSEFQEISTNHDISFNREFQSSSLNYSECQTEPSNYSKQEDQLRNSRGSVEDEFYGQEARQTHPHNFNGSTLITGAHVCDSISNHAEAEIIAAELPDFSSTANGEYDFSSTANGEYCFDWICQPQSYPASDENIYSTSTNW